MCNIVSLYSCSFCFKKHQFLVYVRGVILWNMVLLCLLISLWTANTGMVRMGEPSSGDASVWWNCIRSVGGWAYPSEKYEFVSWDDEIPNIWKNKIHVPNQQPDQVNCCIEVRARYQSGWFRQIIEISPPPSLEKKRKKHILGRGNHPPKVVCSEVLGQFTTRKNGEHVEFWQNPRIDTPTALVHHPYLPLTTSWQSPHLVRKTDHSYIMVLFVVIPK